MQSNVTAVELGHPTVLIITMEAGSDFEISIDFGDGTLVQQTFADPSELVDFEHTYDTVGSYQINVTAVNER